LFFKQKNGTFAYKIIRKVKKKVLSLLAFCIPSMTAFAQEVGEYGFLELPVSSHAAALGGTSISVVEPEAALVDQNPALLCPEMNRQLYMSYMNYVSDINLGYASYTNAYRGHGAWQVGSRFVNYGEFEGYDEDGVRTGTFGAKDIAIHAGIGYPINDKWRIGASSRAIYSKYENESAFALGVDVGVNYYNEASGRSFSAVLSNIGGQLVKMENRRCSLPTQLSVGVTKEVEHLPFCFSLTGIQLLDWDQDYRKSDGSIHEYGRGEQILNHLLWGVEWIATETFYVAGAYSYRRQREFSGDGGFLRGLSIGAGLNWRQWSCQVSYASYNAIGGSLLVGIGYSL